MLTRQGWLLHAWRCSDDRISMTDIHDRMTADPNYFGKELKKPPKNTLSNHIYRGCRKQLGSYNDPALRDHPHRATIESLEKMSFEKIFMNTVLSRSAKYPGRLVRVKLVRKNGTGQFEAIPMEVTQENYLTTTFPLDHFCVEDFDPVTVSRLEFKLSPAISLLFDLQHKADLHGVPHWRDLDKQCLPESWFDRSAAGGVVQDTYDGGCDICTWTSGQDAPETPHRLNFNYFRERHTAKSRTIDLRQAFLDDAPQPVTVPAPVPEPQSYSYFTDEEHQRMATQGRSSLSSVRSSTLDTAGGSSKRTKVMPKPAAAAALQRGTKPFEDGNLDQPWQAASRVPIGAFGNTSTHQGRPYPPQSYRGPAKFDDFAMNQFRARPDRIPSQSMQSLTQHTTALHNAVGRGPGTANAWSRLDTSFGGQPSAPSFGNQPLSATNFGPPSSHQALRNQYVPTGNLHTPSQTKQSSGNEEMLFTDELNRFTDFADYPDLGDYANSPSKHAGQSSTEANMQLISPSEDFTEQPGRRLFSINELEEQGLSSLME